MLSTQLIASIFFYEILRKATCWIRFKDNLISTSQNYWQWQSIVKMTEIIVILLLLLSCFSTCPTLCDPIDSCPPGYPVPGILQARILEWVAISFSNAWKKKVKVKSLSRVRLLASPWTAAYQALPPWEFPGKSTGVSCHCLLVLLLVFTKIFLYKM